MIDAAAPPLCARGVRKSFVAGGVEQRVLDGVDLQVESGEAVGIVGASGAGKSTLLHILGGLDAPDEGAVRVDGIEISRRAAASDDLAAWRNARLGFVFQFHYLLAEFSALENAAMPLFIRRLPRREALAAGARSLARLGLSAHAHKTPSQLSGGERQRAAVARALAGGPACVLGTSRPAVWIAKTPTRFRFAVGARARRRRRFGRRQPRRALDRAAGSAAFLRDGKLSAIE